MATNLEVVDNVIFKVMKKVHKADTKHLSTDFGEGTLRTKLNTKLQEKFEDDQRERIVCEEGESHKIEKNRLRQSEIQQLWCLQRKVRQSMIKLYANTGAEKSVEGRMRGRILGTLRIRGVQPNIFLAQLCFGGTVRRAVGLYRRRNEQLILAVRSRRLLLLDLTQFPCWSVLFYS